MRSIRFHALASLLYLVDTLLGKSALFYLERASTALLGVIWRGGSAFHKFIHFLVWLDFRPGIFSFTRWVFRHLGYLLFRIIRCVQYGKSLEGSAPFLRVPLERCFAQAVFVVSRVSDAFERFPIQQLRCCSLVSYSGLESSLILLRVHIQYRCRTPFFEGIRSFGLSNGSLNNLLRLWQGRSFPPRCSSLIFIAL